MNTLWFSIGRYKLIEKSDKLFIALAAPARSHPITESNQVGIVPEWLTIKDFM